MLKSSFAMTLGLMAGEASEATGEVKTASEFAPAASEKSVEERRRWVQTAELLKPQLYETDQKPQALVRAVADPRQYLRWRMEDTGELSALEARGFRKGESFLLDFGGHRTGYFSFAVRGSGSSVDAPLRLRLTFGEVPGDVAEPFSPYHGELSSSWLPEEVVTIDFLPQKVRLPRRYAFRFVKVEVLDTSPNYAAHFSDLGATAVSSAKDGLVKRLPAEAPEWVRHMDEVALATLRDCMQTTFEDGPRRDQRLWIGDLRLQARANYLTYRNYGLVKRCLYLFAGLSRESDGYLPACVFEKPVPSTTETFIVDYAALYGAILLDYLEASGDRAAAVELWPVAKRQLDLLLVNVDSSGMFTSPKGSWTFIDWSRELDRTAAMQGVMVYSCGRVLELGLRVGAESQVKEYPALIAKMKAAARAECFDSNRGVCVSGPAKQVSWASQAWLGLSGCLTQKESARALRQAVLEDAAATRPTTAYLYHHVVEAMLQCGMNIEALTLMRTYWGGMVDAGADTFWEAYDLQDSRFSPYGDVHVNSFCHAWSCTPAWFFRLNDGALLRSASM